MKFDRKSFLRGIDDSITILKQFKKNLNTQGSFNKNNINKTMKKIGLCPGCKIKFKKYMKGK